MNTLNRSSKTDERTENNFVLSHKEATAASPDDMAVCGEEDPGEGLEFLVSDHAVNE